ncbi:hypothetical protein G6F70_006138 [Rhizopus microsporus]|uniref:Cysteine-rich transmembrane CYSTM domain-containing protein n=2 Tax=Rhizopus TaxID=4842 RepID=A0A367IXW7_RHIAZ|nr:hypothetical protein G6F71_005994 [Rhizopus microsporus]RCH82518.1 hypothetical protein CU097_004272 [Rhizopus azygosporus]KAG1198034.1 hypothetical protein G6F70_006138 [Rhizopus microsporus]KAG1209777.1 hypothetical protein G6F69_006050 [Rhizopus microsporus]KAG1231434.1 hypothetical protein G6F67_005746 [Rhizopus microsporus]
MSEPTISANTMSEIPMTPLAAPASIYPASENIMTTQQNQANSGEQEQQDQRSILRLRGGGCITDCLAAIGCCCICEECCC